MRKSVNSLQVAKPSGSYSQVLKVGDFVYISGQRGFNLDLEIEKSLEEQVETIFKNTSTLLSELKMHINQVTRVMIYAKKGIDIDKLDKLYQAYFKHPYPARTIVFVDKLKEDEALVEIAFDAIDLTAYEVMQDCVDDGCDGCDDEDCEESEN